MSGLEWRPSSSTRCKSHNIVPGHEPLRVSDRSDTLGAVLEPSAPVDSPGPLACQPARARSGGALCRCPRPALGEQSDSQPGRWQFHRGARDRLLPLVGSDDAELVPRWVLKHPRRPLACLRARGKRCAGGSHLVDERLRVIDEEVQVNSSLGRLRLRHGLKGHERGSVRAPVHSLERHVRPPWGTWSPRVAEASLPKLGQLVRVGAIHSDSDLLQSRHCHISVQGRAVIKPRYETPGELRRGNRPARPNRRLVARPQWRSVRRGAPERAAP